MELFVFLLVMAALAALLIGVQKGLRDKPKRSPTFPVAQTAQPEHDTDRLRDMLIEQLDAAIEGNISIVRTLYGLMQADGTTTSAELDILFSFLRRLDSTINVQHRPYFGLVLSDLPPLSDKYFEELVASLEPCPIDSRLDIVSSAQAIVAVGGQPRKREARMLSRLQDLIHAK